MKKDKFTCICCWFYTLDDWFWLWEICPICFWEASQFQNIHPLIWWWPNDSLVDEQKKILLKIPTNIKEINGIKRNPRWRPIPIEKIKDKNKPYIEKWHYEENIVPFSWNLREIFYLEAQKYNPTDN